MVFFQPLMNWRRRAPRGVAARTSSSTYELILPASTAQNKILHHCSKALTIETIRTTPRALHQAEVHVRYKEYKDPVVPASGCRRPARGSFITIQSYTPRRLIQLSNLNVKSAAASRKVRRVASCDERRTCARQQGADDTDGRSAHESTTARRRAESYGRYGGVRSRKLA